MINESARYLMLTQEQARTAGQMLYWRDKICVKCGGRWFYTIADRCWTCQRRRNSAGKYDDSKASARRKAEALRDEWELERLQSLQTITHP